MAEKVILEVVAETGGASKGMNDLTDDTKKVSKETENASTNFQVMGMSIGGLKSAFAKVIPTIKGMFGSIKAGIMSTGVGALVIAFAALMNYFTSTEEGASKLKQILAGFGVVVGNIQDKLSRLGEAMVGAFSNPKQAIADLWQAIKTNIVNRVEGLFDTFGALGRTIKAAFSLDWDGVKENAAEFGESMVQVATGVDDLFGKAIDSVKEFAKETKREIGEAVQLEKDLLALQQEERRNLVEKAKVQEKVAELRANAKDMENFTNQQRLDFTKEAIALTEKQLDADLKIAEEKLRQQQLANTFSDSNQEDLEAEAQLEADLHNLRKANFQMKKGFAGELKGINSQLAAEQKAAQAEIDAADAAKALATKTSADKLLEYQRANSVLMIEDAIKAAAAQLEIDRQKELDAVAGMENVEALKAEINKKYNLKKQAQNKATSDAERKLGVGDLGAAASLLGGMADMEQEGTKKWKQMKIAEARINSFVAAQAAFSSMAAIPIVGTAMGTIAAMLALHQGQKQVDAINATEIPKMARGGVVGGYGSGTSDSVNARLSKGEVVINAKSAKMFRGALSNMNVAGGGVGFARGGATTPGDGAGFNGFSNEPLKAYVLTDEMTNSQDRLSKIRRRSSI
tara:strand:- start:7016 stop:8902 length:1887 start_codon:yes stop_codon:yes gene_type:complete